MENITVAKKALIKTLRANRTKHQRIFVRAQEVYREKMIEELDRALAEAREGQAIKRAFFLPVPEDHTADFDTALAMLQWEVSDQVELDYRDFKRYVENQWEWAASFAANTQSYVVS